MKSRRFFVEIRPLLLATAFLLLSPTWSKAHGVGYHQEADRQAIVLKFEYSSGEPMAYAQTLVFAPDDPKIEYQNGRTDRRGRFAFHPDQGGDWQVIVSDGQGHQVKAQLEVTANIVSESQVASDSQTGGTGVFKWLNAVLGVSLIGNIGLAAAVLKRKKKAANPSKGEQNGF